VGLGAAQSGHRSLLVRCRGTGCRDATPAEKLSAPSLLEATCLDPTGKYGMACLRPAANLPTSTSAPRPSLATRSWPPSSLQFLPHENGSLGRDVSRPFAACDLTLARRSIFAPSLLIQVYNGRAMSWRLSMVTIRLESERGNLSVEFDRQTLGIAARSGV